MKKNLPLIIGIAMVGFMTYQIRNGNIGWAIIYFVFAVVNLAIWFARDEK